ncbi:SRPBCC family protein [Kitasatospora sp. NPDC052896]|uniref:SRPBCC family protein n=1 Tax=Kitasatospora sp. NPDC052896 TaxID=3364061 RepID=UPI0037C98F47
MDFTHEFRVSLPVEPAWELFTDLERLAPCMPGAELTEVEGERFHGTVKVRVGPVTVQYKGVASFEERDGAARTVRVKATGRDTRGQGNADAHITARLAPDGDGTRVTVGTRLSVTGKAAQFGKGVVEDVSGKLLGQFVDCLEQRLAAERGPVAPTAGEAPGTGAGVPAAVVPPAVPADQEPLDLLGAARGALLRRLVPVAAGALLALGLACWLRRRGRPGCRVRGGRRA